MANVKAGVLPKMDVWYLASMSSANSQPEDEYVPSRPVATADPAAAELVELADSAAGEQPLAADDSFIIRRRRRTMLPLALFLFTCVSVFWAGAGRFAPHMYLLADGDLIGARQTVLANWQNGLVYMACLLGILFCHEMGHFVATLLYRIPASLPYFLPLPISPIGTLGAVIGMDGLKANRKEIFDIGLAGPLAGLAVAAPILWIGIQRLDLTGTPGGGVFAIDLPLLLRLVFYFRPPDGYVPGEGIYQWQLNPYFMAGWVGLLITGLNMLPVSQLDGGHVLFALFRRRAHALARWFMVLAIAFIVFSGLYSWSLMIVLIMLIGTDHPPTRDDNVPLGWFRTALGFASLAIPILCFPPRVFTEM